MDDTSGDEDYEPGEVAERLFFTDADGDPCEPEEAVSAALDGDWERLEPEAAALAADESAAAYDRFLALGALARWGSPAGYDAVRRATLDPDAQPWREMSIDRFHSIDNTFALIAEDVGNSLDMAKVRGTEPERFAALASLIGITDRVYFEHNLSTSGLRSNDIVRLRVAIEAAIEHGIDELAAAPTEVPLPQWVRDQVEELIEALGTVDKDAADGYAARLQTHRD